MQFPRKGHEAWHRALALVVLLALAPHVAADERPNFLIFLTDDQGWGDLGCYGHPRIQSPRIDRFAREGLRFTQCYAACSVCSPSRASILTGRTPYRNGVWRWIPNGSEYHLRSSEITVAKLLKDRGYATCHAGKWHLNGKFNSRDQPQPDDHGYDWWLATQNNASPHHVNPTNYVRNREPAGRIEGASSTIAANEVITWLREKKPADSPFFVTLWTHEPHLPIESLERFQAPYADIEDEGLRQHHGNITQLDHAFGLLLDALEALGHADNTLVVFTSDNGPEGSGEKGRTRGSTGGLRGRKRHTHEGGIRVPGILRWPSRFRATGLAAGSVSDEPVIGSDIFPTICEILEIPPPDDRKIDGASWLPLFRKEPLVRSQPLYWRNHLAPARFRVALREGDWKIIASDDLTNFELYNLRLDPAESVDRAAEEPLRFERMKEQLVRHDAAVLADGPDWWRREEETARNETRAAAKPIAPGRDRTGTFDVVLGADVKRSDLGFLIAASGEGLALREIDPPIRGRAVFRLRCRVATEAKTRNALLAFGATANNEDLIKAGAAIGLGRHVVFEGDWSRLARGSQAVARFDPDAGIEIEVHVDLPRSKLTSILDGQSLERALPAGLTEIRYLGPYVKGTSSEFSDVKIERDPVDAKREKEGD